MPTIQKFRSHISILTSICNIIGFMLALCLGKSPPFFWFIRRNRFQHSMRIFILHLFLLKRKGQEAYFWPHPVFFFFFNFIDKMNIHECNMKILQTRLIFVFNFIDKTLGEALAYHAIYLGISTFPIKILYLKKNKIKSSLKTKNKKRFFYLLKKKKSIIFFFLISLTLHAIDSQLSHSHPGRPV